MASKLPPLLEQYLALPPEAALIMVTGVVGASTNWLVLRYLCSFLGSPGGDDDDTAVLLVSFMRDYSFWRDGAGRLVGFFLVCWVLVAGHLTWGNMMMRNKLDRRKKHLQHAYIGTDACFTQGIDLEALGRKRRFSFLDGLTCLFAASDGVPSPAPVSVSQQHPKPLTWSTAHGISGITASLIAALEALQSSNKAKKKPILIVDQPDLLLAATTTTTTDVRDMLLDARERAHAAVVTLAADGPLVKAAAAAEQQQGQGQQRATGLEQAHAALTLGVAHEADVLLCLRLLDTGAAGDVGGVLRITRGGGGGGGLDVEEHEYLYRVGSDGGVKVFERGQ